MMQRRTWFKAALGALAAVVGVKDTKAGLPGMPDTIEVDTPGSERIEVYNRETGEIASLVQRVCQSGGWIDKIREERVEFPDTMDTRKIMIKRGGKFVTTSRVYIDPATDKIVIDRVHGPWAARWKESKW